MNIEILESWITGNCTWCQKSKILTWEIKDRGYCCSRYCAEKYRQHELNRQGAPHENQG